MGYSEFDETESGPYGAVIPAGGLPPEYADAYAEPTDAAPQPQPGEGLPADVLASLELPGRENLEQSPQIVPDERPAHDLIEGFQLDLPRGGWVKFGSILDVSGSLRKRIITQIGVLTKRVRENKASAHEQVNVDNEVTTALLSAIVEAWSYDVPTNPLPKDALDRLPGLVVDEVSSVAAEYMKMLLSKTGGNQGSETDPQSPQRPSAG